MAGGPRYPHGPLMAVTAGGILAVLCTAVATLALGLVEADGTYPDEWDERVTDYVAFVENERGLDFEHPVHVEFVPPEEYTERTTFEDAELAEEDRAMLGDVTAGFRALGMVSGDFDPLAASNAIADSGTLAFYDLVDHRIVVKGTALTPDVEATVVHELTHALQDQHFDLDRLNEMDVEQAAAFHGLIEGDAGRIENAYVEAFDDATFAEYIELSETAVASAEQGIDDVPEALIAYFASPYMLGEAFTVAVTAASQLDEAFEDPPRGTYHLMNPLRYLDGTTIDEADLPALAHDVTSDEPDGVALGAVDIYLMLAQRIDPLDALSAVDDWAGGSSRLERDADGRVCIRMALLLRDDEVMTPAIEAWRAAMPPAAHVRVETGDRRLDVHSCDPGVDAEDALEPRLLDALAVPALRSFFVAGMVESGADQRWVECIVEEIWRDVPWSGFLDGGIDPTSGVGILELMGPAGKVCGPA